MRKVAVLMSAAAVAACAFASTASATTFFVGVQGGGGWHSSDVNIPAYGAPGKFTVSSDGVLAGGFLGADMNLTPTMTIGIDADYNWASVDGSHLSGAVAPAGELYTLEEKSNASVRARLGFVSGGGAALWYIAGGLSMATVDAKYTPLAGGVKSADLSGWNLGGGVQGDIGSGWFWKAEYRYTSLGEEGVVHVGPSTFDLTGSDVIVGFGMKF